MASGCACGGLGWLVGKIPSLQGLERPDQAAQGTAGVPIPEKLLRNVWQWHSGPLWFNGKRAGGGGS